MTYNCGTCWRQCSGHGRFCGSCERDARLARSDPIWAQAKRRFSTESRAKPERRSLAAEDRAVHEERELELERELLLIFNLADYDGDSEITFPEWEAAFRALDRNGDKKLSRKEWVLKIESTALFDRIPKKYASCLTRVEWCSAFKDFDSNGDGKISFQEWLTAKKVKVTQPLNEAVWDQTVVDLSGMYVNSNTNDLWTFSQNGHTGEATCGDDIERYTITGDSVTMHCGHGVHTGHIEGDIGSYRICWHDGDIFEQMQGRAGRRGAERACTPDEEASKKYWLSTGSEDSDDGELPQQQDTLDAQLWHPNLVQVVPDAEPGRSWSPRSTHHVVRCTRGDAPALRSTAPRYSGKVGKRLPRVLREPESKLISCEPESKLISCEPESKVISF